MVSFRKKVKILPGLNLNFSKSGVSATIGTRGASVTFGKRGTYVNAGIPGTGIYSRKKVTGATTSSRSRRRTTANSPKPTYNGPKNTTYHRYNQTCVPVDSTNQIPIRSKAANLAWGTVFAIMGTVCLILAFVSPLMTLGRILIGGVGIFCFAGSITYFLSKSIEDEIKECKVKVEKREEIKVKEAKDVVIVQTMRTIPEYNDQPTAAAAFDIACLNYELANTVDEILENSAKATSCLAFAKYPLDASWGCGNSILPLYAKMHSGCDDALMRVTMNIRNAGGDYSDIRNYLFTAEGKEKWDSTFA